MRTRARRLVANLKTRAAQGEVEAQAILADRYSTGDGVPKSKRLARVWYERAAAKGSALAMGELGVLLGRGLGGPADRQRANRLYRRAAALGYGGAMGDLGFVLKNGLGTRANPRLAFKWYWRAAELGEVDSLLELPHLIDAHGFRHDRRKLALMFRKAARSGDEGAMTGFGAMSCYQLAEYYEETGKSPRLHLLWLREAARRGVADAQCGLGVQYINGEGVRCNPRSGARLYAAAAEQGHSWATHLLGLCYRDGLGVRRDGRKARGCFERAIRAAREEESNDGDETLAKARAALRALKSGRTSPRRLKRAR